MSDPCDPPFEVPKKVKDYELLEILGSGSFSVVYKAACPSYHNAESEFVAIKVIPKKKLSDDGDTERLKREVDTMSFLIHESIVAFHEFFSDDDYYYLVMEFCPGGTVYQYISSGNHLRETQAATIFRQIVDAIAFCHEKNVAHRDLKLQNILITTFPNIKVSDFGLCSHITGDAKLHTFCGSPCYSAPECINHIDYDGKLADIWSLGVILYELVTNSHPWNVSNIPQMVQQISKAQYTIPSFVTSACADLIESMLKVNALERNDIESIMCHPWLKIAAKKHPVAFKSCLPPLKKAPTFYTDSSLVEKTKKANEPMLNLCAPPPHSTVNVMNNAFLDLSAKPRIIGKSISPVAHALIKRRTSYTKSNIQTEDFQKITMQKKTFDSVEPLNF